MTREQSTATPAPQEAGGCPFSRRGFFAAAGAAAAAFVAVPSTSAAAAPARAGAGAKTGAKTGAAAKTGAGAWQHAVGAPRGSDVAAVVNRSQQGRFGLLFPQLKAYAPPDALLGELARSMTDPRQPALDPSNGDQWDNHDITGGYTFLGQFIDHDITRDTTPLSEQRKDPHALRNFDTPFLDLGSVYGRGPSVDPQLYDRARPGYLLVDERDGVYDLPRAADGTAYLGDPRNDENLIVAQLHVAFLKFHNALMDEGLSLAEAKKLTVWHFQWLVVHEFLPRVCGQQVVDELFARRDKVPWYRPRNPLKPMIPIEFSAAAYRIGHSMIRPEYEMNDADTGPIFSHPGDPRDDLRGSRPVPSNYRADWSYFFDLPSRPRPDGLNFSRLIDTRLALPLHDLPPTVVSRNEVPLFTDLAERNLLRAARLGVAAGQDVATALGQKPLTNAQLGLTDPRWGGKAPLWFYVLKEAELTQGGRRLGPTGARLVAGTLLTLLFLDRASYVHARWRPGTDPFTVGDFIERAGLGGNPNMPEADDPEPEFEVEDPAEVEEEVDDLAEGEVLTP